MMDGTQFVVDSENGFIKSIDISDVVILIVLCGYYHESLAYI